MSLHVLIFLEIVVQLEHKTEETETETENQAKRNHTHKDMYYSLGSPAFLSRLSVYFLFLSEMLNLLTAVVFLFNLFYLRYLLSSRFGSFIPPPHYYFTLGIQFWLFV